ncbi:hypothetical protein [Catellatospora sp. NPDC049609]|uniref:hypothetical protein n=1 Tax=Catellatospora sp. NPDC049609 TaxID=3155505 RepID=UPI003424CDB8
MSETGPRPLVAHDISAGELLRFVAKTAVFITIVVLGAITGHHLGPALGPTLSRLDVTHTDDFVRPAPPDLADLPARIPVP